MDVWSLTERLSEKYLKKLLKNTDKWTDVEDGLKRLDRLTQEEAGMAGAKVLKATDAVDDGGRVRGVEDIALNADNRVAGVGDQVQGVSDRVQGVGDQVQGFSDRVQGVGDQVQGFSDQVQGVSDQVQGFGDQVLGFSDQVQGVGDQVLGVSNQLKGIDDMVAVVRDGTQYTFNQSSKHHLTPNVHRRKRGQGSHATTSRWRRPDRTFVVSELHSCWTYRLNYRHRESITTGSS